MHASLASSYSLLFNLEATARSEHRPLRAFRIVAMILVAFAAGKASSPAHAQTNEWTWMAGSNTLPASCSAQAEQYLCGNPGIYGTEDKPALTNVPGGRTDSAVWTDSNGNLWLFGGFGTDSAGTVGELSDLWEFNPSSREWVWMGGPSTVPTPCPLNTIGFFCGNSGVYGTQAVFAAGNIPGGRDSAVSWTDSGGNFWLFGGEGYDSSGNYSWLNDLWKFDPSLNEWAWMGGASSNGNGCRLWGYTGERICVLPSTAAGPGGRYASSAWTDRQGNFWLFGGMEIDSSGNFCNLDDMWEFSPATAQWTSRGGATVGISNESVPAVYGVPGKLQAGQTPGGRWDGAAWADNSGNLWLFGGQNSIQNMPGPLLNDIWEFSPQLGEWAWMGGTQGANYGLDGSVAVYGQLGVPAITNVSGGRVNEATWTDAEGNFWMSGGVGQGSGPTSEDGLNDLWVFSPSGREWTWMGGSNSTYTPQNAPLGVYGTVGVPAPGNLPGTREFAMSWTDNKGNFWFFGGEGVDSLGNFGYLNDLWEYAPPPVPASIPGFEFYWTPILGNSTTYPSGNMSYTFYTFTGGGFNSPIALSASGLPNGATASFNPSPMNGEGNFQLNISVGANSPVGDYTIDVTGTGGSMTQTAAVGLALQAPYFVDPAAATFDVQFGTQGTMGITVSAEAGFNSPVVLTAAGQPSGVSIIFNPDSITPGESSAMTVSVASNVAPGGYLMTVTGTASGVTEQSQFMLDVTAVPPPTFIMTPSSTSLTVPAGATVSTPLTLTPLNGFTGVVTFTCSCSAIPAEDAYSIGSADLNIAGSPASVTFTIENLSQAAARPRDVHPFFPAMTLAAALCFVGFRRRDSLWTALLILLAVGSLGVISSCGGGGGSGNSGGGGGSNPISFNVTVTATSGAIQQASTISVTLN